MVLPEPLAQQELQEQAVELLGLLELQEQWGVLEALALLEIMEPQVRKAQRELALQEPQAQQVLLAQVVELLDLQVLQEVVEPQGIQGTTEAQDKQAHKVLQEMQERLVQLVRKEQQALQVR